MSLRKRRKFNIPILMTTGVLGGGGPTPAQQYQNTVLALSNIISYLPLTEDTGTTANDLSPNAYHGTYAGASLTVGGMTGPISGTVAPLFGGTANVIKLYAAGFIAAATGFNGKKGHLSIWVKSDNWADATPSRRFIKFLGTPNIHYINMEKTTVNTFTARYNHSAGLLSKGVAVATVASEWFNVQMSWQDDDFDSTDNDNGTVRIWLNNVEQTPALAATGVFSDTSLFASAGALLGADNDAGTSTPWLGGLAHLVVFSEPQGAASRAALATLP